jgi:hypothetical protein
VRRTPGLQGKSPRSQIQSQRVVDELRRRNELHVGHDLLAHYALVSIQVVLAAHGQRTGQIR